MSAWKVGAYVSEGITYHDVVDEHGNCRGTFLNDDDAHLMAASRDLLECCEGAHAALSYFMQGSDGPDITLDLIRQIASALVKAKGETA